jgi:glutaminyl-peptide cyclotransferase
MAEWNVRPLAFMLGAVVLLMAGVMAWGVAGFPLPAAITGSDERATTTAASGVTATSAAVTPPASTATSAAATPPARTATSAAAPPTGAETAAAASDLAPRASTNRFDGARAFALLREQVRVYGWRPAGSKALRRLAARLRALLPAGRFEPVAGHKGLRNVVGSLPGRGKPIVIGAHYDVEARPVGFVGANDGAAGTAAVVELARKLARAPRRPSDRALRFVLFDGEEEPAGCQDFLSCALRGSKAYAKRHGDQTHSLVLLDYIAEKRGLSFPHEGGSDPALWAKLRAAAGAVGVGSLFTDTEGIEILDDHTPFVDAGIPAIDVIDFDYPQADSLQDTVDKVSERSLDAVGETVYRLITRLRVER